MDRIDHEDSTSPDPSSLAVGCAGSQAKDSAISNYFPQDDVP